MALIITADVQDCLLFFLLVYIILQWLHIFTADTNLEVCLASQVPECTQHHILPALCSNP